VNVRVTLALGVVLVALVTYLRFTAPSDGPTTTTETIVEPPLLRVDTAQVSRLELDAGGQRLTLVQTPDGWADATGRRWPSSVPTDLLDALTTLRPIAMVDPMPSDIRDYRLGPDATRLRVIDRADHLVLGLEIGGRNPAWTGLYARRDGDPGVVLIGALLQWELDKLRNTARSVSSP
jgi:hypothetical protein